MLYTEDTESNRHYVRNCYANTKSETLNPKQIQITQIQNSKHANTRMCFYVDKVAGALNIRILDFDIV